MEIQAKRGEEFRDDLRGTAAARAAAVSVRRLLPAEVLAELTRPEPWRSMRAVAQTFALIAVAVGVAWTQFTWWIVVPAVLPIGTQQHALSVLARAEVRPLRETFGRLFAERSRVPSAA